jgi:hypothetical protein
MDIEEILEKIIRFISDPKGREVVKTFLYLFFPLLILIIIRNAARRRPAPAGKASKALVPKTRPGATETIQSAESVKETMAKEQQKIHQELQIVFGREQNVLARAKKSLTQPEVRPESPPAQSRKPDEKKILQEELLKLFSRRQS